MTGNNSRADEQIIVSGGCALSYYENGKPAQHDTYWGNFIDSVMARLPEIEPELAASGDQLTWLIYRPSYITRGQEEGVDYIKLIQFMVAKTPAKLIWFDTKQQLIDYLNKGQDRDQVKISRFEYFGHSNMLCFMFDYSNRLNGSSPDYGILHENDLRKIDRDIFSSKAYVQSWGCHSGESYSQAWLRRFRVPMIGAIGKTDYSNGAVPFLSSPDGQWAQ